MLQLRSSLTQLVVTAYSILSTGEVVVELVFPDSRPVAPCTPVCDGLFCGDSGCGTKCGMNNCGDGEFCSTEGRCSVPCDNVTNANKDCSAVDIVLSAECEDDYYGEACTKTEVPYTRECGPDAGGCGFTCGSCGSGYECDTNMGLCQAVVPCNHDVPVCSGRKPSAGNYFCGTDCQWHAVDEFLIDLVPAPRTTLIESIIQQ